MGFQLQQRTQLKYSLGDAINPNSINHQLGCEGLELTLGRIAKMEIMTQKLIPGIVALLCGVVFLFGREEIEQKIINFHVMFWRNTLKLQGEVSRFSELFLKVLILFLGVVFLSIGIFLIYQFIKRFGA